MNERYLANTLKLCRKAWLKKYFSEYNSQVSIDRSLKTFSRLPVRRWYTWTWEPDRTPGILSNTSCMRDARSINQSVIKSCELWLVGRARLCQVRQLTINGNDTREKTSLRKTTNTRVYTMIDESRRESFLVVPEKAYHLNATVKEKQTSDQVNRFVRWCKMEKEFANYYENYERANLKERRRQIKSKSLCFAFVCETRTNDKSDHSNTRIFKL